MNSKKIISSVSLTTAILATGIISQEAHADSVDTTTTTVSQAQSQPVTAEQVASAKASYDTNQEAQAKAQSVVDSKKQALETAKANTTAAQDAVAQAETVTAQATEVNIQSAKEAIPTAEAKVQPAKETVETAKTDVTTKEANQSQAQAAVNEAQGNVNQAQKAVAEATQIQSEKQTAVDTSAKEVETAKQGVVDAQATVAEKTDKVSQAGQTVETAKQNDVNLDADTKEAEINVEKADQAAQVAKSEVATAKAKADETAQALKDAEFNHPTHVVMTDEFKNNLKQYVFGSLSGEALNDLVTKTIASEDESRKLNADYLSTFTPDTTGQKYDVTNIPLELQTELSQYFAYLVNDVRQQLGTSKLVVNTDAIKFATLVAEKYDKNHDPFSGHDNKAINEAAKEMGYWYNRKNQGNAYENLTGNSPDSAYNLDSDGNSTYKIGDKVELTKSELYKLIAENVSRFIYEGSSNGHYGHAISLVKQPSLGIAFTLSHTDFGFGTVPMIETHVLYTPVHDLVNFDKKLLDESKNVPDLKIPDKQAAEVADRAAQAALVTATAQAQAAQTRFEQAKATYDALVATPRQTADAEAKLATAKAELANAQTALETAENTLATVTASYADKVAALDMAKASRDEAVNALTAAQSKLDAANDELAQRETATTVAKAKLAELEQAVIDAKATYEQLVKAKDNLETARQAYTQAVTAQEAAQAAYDKAMVVLTNAKAQTALSGTKYTNLKVAYDARIAYEEAQRKSKEEVLRRQAESDAKAKQVRQDVNGTQSNRVNSNTHVGLPEFISSTNEVKTTSFSAAQVATAEATQAVVNRRGTTDYQAPLPQTGESDTAVYLLAGLGMLGLSGVTARKRRG